MHGSLGDMTLLRFAKSPRYGYFSALGMFIGHYMAWVKAPEPHGKVEKIADSDEDNEDWFVFDDDEVSPCKTEDVLKLKGGGDWHMSYINFYRAVSFSSCIFWIVSSTFGYISESHAFVVIRLQKK